MKAEMKEAADAEAAAAELSRLREIGAAGPSGNGVVRGVGPWRGT